MWDSKNHQTTNLCKSIPSPSIITYEVCGVSVSAETLVSQLATPHPNNRNDRHNITLIALYFANNLTVNWAQAYGIRHSNETIQHVLLYPSIWCLKIQLQSLLTMDVCIETIRYTVCHSFQPLLCIGQVSCSYREHKQCYKSPGWSRILTHRQMCANNNEVTYSRCGWYTSLLYKHTHLSPCWHQQCVESYIVQLWVALEVL